MNLAMLVFACLVGLLVVGVALLIAAVRRRSVAPPGAGCATAEEFASLVQGRQVRLREERQRILQMVHAGRVSDDEGDRLLATLERETTTRACPLCGGEIHVSAVKCPHCRRFLMAQPGCTARLARSRDRMLAGVCGGVAAHMGADPSLVRMLAVLAALFTGLAPVLLAYLVLAVILPNEAAD